MENPAIHSRIALFSLLILSLCAVCCLHVFPQHMVGHLLVSTTAGVPLEEEEKRELCPVKGGTREMLMILSVPGNYEESAPF